jgi:alpha-glucosidase
MTQRQAMIRAPWWQSAVVYQIHPRSFADSNGDGIGDLPGITRHLGYLTSVLGVDAIWINPFHRSGGVDGGYDVTDHCDVDPELGCPDDFDALIKAAHAHGLRVIIDFVPACTSTQHPWFAESRRCRRSAKRNWYTWRDPGPGGGPPNNWVSHWGGPAWTWDPPTGQYYLHTYLADMADLNWRQPAVRRAMLDVARFWLNRGVDGYRVDSAHIIAKDPQLRDNPPNASGRLDFGRPHGEIDTLLHIHDRGHPDVHHIYREFRHLLDRYSAAQPRVAMAEIALSDIGEWASYYGAALDELHLPFNFRLMHLPWNSPSIRTVVEDTERVIPAGAWPCWVLGNHDEPRLASRIGQERARCATMLLLTLRGTPVLYYGDELAMRDVPVPPERVRDPWEKRIPGNGYGRDPQRSPMRWNSRPNAGFCPPGIEPWLPIGHGGNVAAQLRDPHSMLSLTRSLIQARRSRRELALGTYHTVTSGSCYAYLRELDGARSLIVMNLSDSAITADLDLGSARVLAATHETNAIINTRHLTLRANQGIVAALT